MSLPDFDPAIHKEISNVPIVRWILGSQPENDLHGRHAAHPAGEASTVISLLQRPRCSDRTYGRGCALYKGCKTDNDRACKETGFTKSCPSGQKLKKNSGRCSYDSSYGTCCTPSGCPAYTSLTSSSYGTNGTDGCEYTCYYTCNMNCPSGTSTSNPGGCGGTCRRCESCCSPSSYNWCSVHSTCHGDCCSDGTLESCDPQCGGSGCVSSGGSSGGGGSSGVDCCDTSGIIQNYGCSWAGSVWYNKCLNEHSDWPLCSSVISACNGTVSVSCHNPNEPHKNTSATISCN
ncbi:MAG: hypothetical protein SO314_04650 [Alphaproteobacteria bacterium]|nr:hypothetical protein [Alphaproteobacteria bacterium]